MKHSILVLALLASFGVGAQTTTDSASNSAAQSGATTNQQVTGNVNASEANSASQSGATSDSRSGAVGNSVVVDQRGPTSQTVNSTTNVSGRVENVNSGTSTQNIVHSGTTTNREITDVHYSGTQTVKNVPGIAMSGPASGPCTGSSGGLGLAGPGWGLGLNGAKVEPTCVVRENVRVIGMAMQSLDGAAYPQEKGELMLLMMDAVRGLGAMNQAIIGDNVGKKGGY